MHEVEDFLAEICNDQSAEHNETLQRGFSCTGTLLHLDLAELGSGSGAGPLVCHDKYVRTVAGAAHGEGRGDLNEPVLFVVALCVRCVDGCAGRSPALPFRSAVTTRTPCGT